MMENTKELAKSQMEKACTALIRDNFFFAVLLLRLDQIVDPSCDTGWTDGKKLGYNPLWIMTLTLKKVIGFIIHEVFHIIMNHPTRRGNRDHELWNIACDHAINPLILEAGFELPDNGLVNRDYKELTAEKIYNLLLDEQEKAQEMNQDQSRPQSQDQDQDQGSNSKEDDSSSSNDDPCQDQDQDKDSGQDQDQGSDPDGDQDQDSGQGQDGDQDQESEPKKVDPGKCGEVRDATNDDGSEMSEAEKADQERKWMVALAQAERIGCSHGELTEGMKRMVDEILHPVLDWRELLKPFVERCAKSDFSWSIPNRRHIHTGLYLPSAVSNDIKEIVFVGDTSGSRSAKEINQVASELSVCSDEFRANLIIIHCDDSVQKVEYFNPGDPVEIEPQGGGGTDFRPPFKWVDDEGIQPSCLVYFTDLECHDYPKDPPPYPVLWIASGKGYGPPPFGEVVYM